MKYASAAPPSSRLPSQEGRAASFHRPPHNERPRFLERVSVVRPLRQTVVVLAFFISAGCDGSSPTENLSEIAGSTMGTTYSVKIAGSTPPASLGGWTAGIEAVLDRVNAQMSTYLRESELSRFNNGKTTEWVDVSPDLVSVIEEAIEISRLSEGAFDVTVGPVVNLWGFGPSGRPERVPSAQEVRDALAQVGYGKLHIRVSPPALRKEAPELYVDLSAIAKGYAVDEIAEYLESHGILRYLVEVGGELRGRGHNAQGVPWKIAIEKPVSGLRAIHTVIEVAGRAVATSGGYRNYFEEDGKRFSHTINPRTGRPITHKLASVTVIEESAMRADALATALMILGPERAFALAVREELAALFIVKGSDGFVENITPTFRRYIVH